MSPGVARILDKMRGLALTLCPPQSHNPGPPSASWLTGQRRPLIHKPSATLKGPTRFGQQRVRSIFQYPAKPPPNKNCPLGPNKTNEKHNGHCQIVLPSCSPVHRVGCAAQSRLIVFTNRTTQTESGKHLSQWVPSFKASLLLKTISRSRCPPIGQAGRKERRGGPETIGFRGLVTRSKH